LFLLFQDTASSRGHWARFAYAGGLEVFARPPYFGAECRTRVADIGEWRGSAHLEARWKRTVLPRRGPEDDGGGNQGRWERRGKFDYGVPRPLFDANIPPGTRFDAGRDGRFLIPVPVGQSDPASAPINVGINWQARLRR